MIQDVAFTLALATRNSMKQSSEQNFLGSSCVRYTNGRGDLVTLHQVHRELFLDGRPRYTNIDIMPLIEMKER